MGSRGDALRVLDTALSHQGLECYELFFFFFFFYVLSYFYRLG